MSGIRSGLFVHERVLEWATQRPEAIAITAAGRSLSYAELVARARAVASRLQAEGVTRGQVVAVVGDRDPGLVIGMLGACLAGTAYLPLDKRYPPGQLTFMVADSDVVAIVCDAGSEAWARSTGRPVIVLSSGGLLASQTPHESVPMGRTDGHQPLYVIYTSGSTGRPKGVIVTHDNLARLIDATSRLFGFGADDVWTFFHSFAFDFSVWEIWGALVHGGRLVIVDHATSRDPAAFHNLVADEGVTVLNQTPSAFALFDRADAASAQSLALRLVIFGGERLGMGGLRGWWKRHPDGNPRLVNMYGITETTVHVTYRELTEADGDLDTSPIGVPLPDLQVSIRDDRGLPVPDGEVGEIYVAGRGLAAGYQNLPEHTAEKFIDIDATRWYRSGDLAAWHGGELFYHGRADNQVKIRGHRIELGQVEAVLARAPGVQIAAAVAESGQLRAYVVADMGYDPGGVRDYLTQNLPPHMVPAQIVRCATLALTANGKLDVSALTPLAADAQPAQRVLTPDEAQLAAVWQDVLKLESIDPDQNFFALGGDSLLAVEIVALAATRGITFSVTDLFAAQTISALASLTAAAPPGDAPRALPFSLLDEADAHRARLLPAVTDVYPMTALQLAMVFHSTATTAARVYQNVMEVDVEAPWDEARFGASLARAISRHESLRTSFALGGFSEPMQVVHETVDLPLSVEEVTRRADIRRRAREWTMRAKDEVPVLDRAPLLRVHVVAGPGGFTVAWRIHHAVMDGWSDALFVSELIGGYLDGIETSAAPPVLRVADYVRDVSLAAKDPVRLSFWKRKLRHAIPADLPRPCHSPSSLNFVNLRLDVSGASAQRLAAHADRLGLPVKSLYLAAFVATAATCTGVADPTVGLVTNGRPESAGAAEAIGLFLNTVPFSVGAHDATSWSALAQKAFEAETELLPHRLVPLASMVPGEPPFGLVYNYVRFAPVEQLQYRHDGRIGEVRSHDETSFPLLVSVVDDGRGTRLEVGYRTDAVDPQVAEGFAGELIAAVNAFAADPGSRPLPVRDLVGGGHLSVHGAIGAAAQRYPENVALQEDGRQTSYRDLWRSSGRLARELLARGVEPGSLVPVLTGRRTEMVVAALGVLRAGAGYVLLDPAWPRERLAQMCQRVDARHGVRHDHGDLAAALGLEWLALPELTARDDTWSGPEVSDAPLAVFFTSGSTGVPKGAVISHRALLRLLIDGPYGFGRQTSTASLCALPWDFAALEMWAPLVHGGTLHLAERVDAAAVGRATAAGVNTLVLPTALFHVLVDEAVEALSGASTVLIGGEPPAPAKVADFLRRHPHSTLFNVYGPVETTGGSTYHRMSGDAVVPEEIPLGIPVPGDGIHVVDGNLREAGDSAVGEILISGAGLAYGYAGSVELTRERFVALPVKGGAVVRAYRTGDLGCLSGDGLLHYRGRADRQLKINGIRVEPGEIERLAERVPSVRRAIVVAIPAASGELALALFIVGGEADTVRERLREGLPEPLVPRHILALHAVPITPNGKTDLRALADDPRLRQEVLATPATEPESAPESEPRSRPESGLGAAHRTVLDHARRILQNPALTLQSDFFTCGANSLHAIRLSAAVASTMGLEIPVTMLLRTRTLADFGDSVNEIAGLAA